MSMFVACYSRHFATMIIPLLLSQPPGQRTSRRSQAAQLRGSKGWVVSRPSKERVLSIEYQQEQKQESIKKQQQQKPS